jgi:hypothetical protein
MSGLLRYVELAVKAKTGVNRAIIAWCAVGALAALAALSWLSVTAFVWLAQSYDPLIAAASVAGFYVVIAAVALIAAAVIRRKTLARSRVALAQRTSTALLDPGMLAIGVQVARAVGWRRIVPLVLIAVVATGRSREWMRHDSTRDSSLSDN